MRKILFSVLLAAILIFTGFVIYRGTNVGKFTVWGVTQISEENDNIDQRNAELTNLVNETYPQTLSRLKLGNRRAFSFSQYCAIIYHTRREICLLQIICPF